MPMPACVKEITNMRYGDAHAEEETDVDQHLIPLLVPATAAAG